METEALRVSFARSAFNRVRFDLHTVFKILLLTALTLMTNQALNILSRDPSLPILGQSALLHFGESVLYSMVLVGSYGFFLRKDRLAFVVAVSGIALASAYPAYLVAGAILYGIASDVPLILYFYLSIVTAIFGLSLSLYKKTKRFPLRHAEFAPTLTTCFFLVALPSIYLSGMGGGHDPAYIQDYTAFVYVVLFVLLVSTLFEKALRIIPLLAAVWCVLYTCLVFYNGDFSTGYFFAASVHLAWAVIYFCRLGKRTS